MVPSDLVPTIDISPFLLDPKSPAVDKIVETVREACTETGFFQITGHGISEELLADLFEASKKFFDLSLEVKKGLDVNKNAGRKGYDSAEAYNGEKLPDLKEVMLKISTLLNNSYFLFS